MQAIVLVGGEGTRLRPLTYGTPKPMVPIMNVPFLERTLERLRLAGIDDVILAAGYLPEAISDYFGDGSRLDVKSTYIIEEVALGTAGALKNVEDHVNGPFFVLNGDVLTSLDLRAMMRMHEQQGGLGVLHLIKVDDPSPFGCVVHDERGRISRFVEKPPRGQEPTNEVNAGTYLLEPQVLDFIPSGRRVSIEHETFPRLLQEGKALYAYTTADYWMDLGRPEHYLSAHRAILDGILQLKLMPQPASTGRTTRSSHSVIPPVYINEDVQIEDGARVGPHVVLGPGCRIGSGATVRDSVLWDCVTVEPNAHIEGSIIASRVRVGAGATIGCGSVIGHDVIIRQGEQLEPGSRVGGRPLDGSNMGTAPVEMMVDS
ncbi:MAG: NDP-sugar synthase [Candidatus Eremiobacteraeota bacterium]|nr:NDP-sugar synthase [Candidatus Eremiobacteraeota bacterium]